jgi:hypothetical protein
LIPSVADWSFLLLQKIKQEVSEKRQEGSKEGKKLFSAYSFQIESDDARFVLWIRRKKPRRKFVL